MISFDKNGRAVELQEKPIQPQSNFAVTGLYFYDGSVVEYAASIEPSSRGELEITDVNNLYFDAGMLHVETMGAGYAWLDTGTHSSLIVAALFTRTIEERQGLEYVVLRK